MNKKGIIRAVVILIILAVNVGCDQWVKSMMRDHIHYYERYLFFDGHVMLVNVQNSGAFLSLGDRLPDPFRFLLLTALPAAALIGGLIYIILKDNFSKLALVAIIFVIGGGMGNLYDRITRKAVTDFIQIKYSWFETGVFNVADVSIMIGVFLLLLDVVLRGLKSRKEEAISEPAR